MAEIQVVIDSDPAVRGAHQAETAVDGMTQKFDRADTKTKDLNKSLGVAGKGFDKVKLAVFGLTASIGGLIATNFALGNIKDFTGGLVGVEKTTGLSGDALNEFAEELIRVSTETPSATAELLALAQTAGQLGVSGKDNLLAFTTTVSDLGTASDLAGEEGATALARLLNITGEAVSSVRTLADVIVALGNNSAATEAEIAGMATRIAQATVEFGLSAAQTAALGAALVEMGVQAEAGGTAVGRTMRALDSAIREAGDGMALLTELTGHSVEELNRMRTADPVGLFRDFAVGVGEAIREGTAADQLLGRLGLSGERILAVIPTIALGADNLQGKLNLMNEQLENGGALQEEADKQFGTLGARMEIFGNTITAVVLKMRDGAGVVADFFDVASQVTKQLFNLSGEEEKATATTTALAGAIRATTTALLVFVGVRVAQYLNSMAIATRINVAVMTELRATALATSISLGASGGVAAAATAATGAVRALAAGVRTLFAAIGPAGWLILGVTAVIEVFSGFSRNARENREELMRLDTTFQSLEGSTTSLSGALTTLAKIEAQRRRGESIGDASAVQNSINAEVRTVEDLIDTLSAAQTAFDPETQFKKFAEGNQLDTAFEDLSRQQRALFANPDVSLTELQRIYAQLGDEAGTAFLDGLGDFVRDNAADVLAVNQNASDVFSDVQADAFLALRNRAAGSDEADPALVAAQERAIAENSKLVAGRLLEEGKLESLPNTPALTEFLESTARGVGKVRTEVTATGEEVDKVIAKFDVGDILGPLRQQNEALKTGAVAFELAFAGRAIGGDEDKAYADAMRARSNAIERVTTLQRAEAAAKKAGTELTVEQRQQIEAEIAVRQDQNESLRRSKEALDARSKAAELAARQAAETASLIEQTKQSLDLETAALRSNLSLIDASEGARSDALRLMRFEDALRRKGVKDIEAQTAAYKQQLDTQRELRDEIADKTAAQSLDDFIDSMRDEVTLLRLSNEERAAQSAVLQAENLLKDANIELTEEQTRVIRDLAMQRDQLAETTEKSAAAEEKAFATLFRDLQNEAALIGLTNQQREQAEALTQAQTAANKEFGQGSIEARDAIAQYMDQMREIQELRDLEDLTRSFATTTATAMADIATDFENATDHIERFINSIIRLGAEKFIVQGFADTLGTALFDIFNGTSPRATQSLLGGEGSGGGFGSLFSSFFQSGGSAINGGGVPGFGIPVTSANGNVVTIPEKFDRGGFISRPTTFEMTQGRRGLAGESGTEVAIAPLRRMSTGRMGVDISGMERASQQSAAESNGDNVTYNITQKIQTSDADSFRRSKRQRSRNIERDTGLFNRKYR